MGIRKEQPGDITRIRQINSEAFETETEANLVDIIRRSGIPHISLVYEENNELKGHIFFTPVELKGDRSGIRIMGLGPMAVDPEFQNKGVGSLLVKAGIESCRAGGYDAIVVLGHPSYYPRFGFKPSVKYAIKSEYEVPDEAFMVLELKDKALKGKRGTIKYDEAFGNE
ncbi:MAG: GNAT family N-acetyltransferase [Candidatus Hodarchaeales archaeon]|jgi:putative acetyltransferase